MSQTAPLDLPRVPDIEAKMIASARPMRHNELAALEGAEIVQDFGAVVGANVQPQGSFAVLRLDNGEGQIEIRAVYGRALALGDELIRNGRQHAANLTGQQPQTSPEPLAELDLTAPYLPLGEVGLLYVVALDEDVPPEPGAEPSNVIAFYLRCGALVVRLELTSEQARWLGLELKKVFRQLDASALTDLTIPRNKAAEILARDRVALDKHLTAPVPPPRLAPQKLHQPPPDELRHLGHHRVSEHPQPGPVVAGARGKARFFVRVRRLAAGRGETVSVQPGGNPIKVSTHRAESCSAGSSPPSLLIRLRRLGRFGPTRPDPPP